MLSRATSGDPAQLNQAVADLLAAHPPSQRLLLVIDQFEELFSQTGRDEQHRFITALNALRQREDCALLIAMRADFYPDLMNSNLWPIDARHRLEIAPLRGGALREAIERPAEHVGVRLEPGLVEPVLADGADEPGVLPLLQETLVLLWDKMVHRLLPLSTYERLGHEGHSDLAVAIAKKADATLAALGPAQQAIASRMFLRFIQFGEGRADTQRQQAVDDLRSPDDNPVLFEETLHHLTNNRLLTLSGEAQDADRKVDIAHEALIAGWPTSKVGWFSGARPN